MRYLTDNLDAAGIPTWAETDETTRSTHYGAAGHAWTHETDTWSAYGGDMAVRVVTTPHGVFRATVRQDDYPEAPDFDCGCPVFRVSGNRFYTGLGLADEPEYGGDSWKNDGLVANDLHAAVDYFSRAFGRDALEVTDRWLHIFHGGSLKTLSSRVDRSGDDFVTYDTRAMRAYWGQTGEMLETSDPEAEEWQAYIDGEVFTIAVEQAGDFDEDGEPTSWETVEGPVGGYYGEAYALEAAEDELEGTIRYLASKMLPLG